MSVLKTTSTLALVVAVLIAAALLTTGFWTVPVARSLVCAESFARSDAMLVENFDPNYLLFERAEALERAGMARTTYVPLDVSPDRKTPNPISVGIAELMVRQARLRAWRPIVFSQHEPISLNAALQIRDRLVAEQVKSLIVLTPGFRSRRSMLVYQATLAPAHITVHCVPVFGQTTAESWTKTWHGIQHATEELIKLWYYRLYVLPFVARRTPGG
jgi:hypothetical protein